MSDKKRLLNDLRVIDLRAELEKRNLDKTGVRGVLIQRLSKYLEEEGHDPETYNFELTSDTKTPTKKTRRTGSAVEQEAEETPAMEDMIVQDDAGEEEETEQVHSENPPDEQEAVTEEKMDIDQKVNRKRESEAVHEASEPKKPCIENDTKEDDPKIENNIDAEDSINLDLGDDELLNEETDSTEKPLNQGQDLELYQSSVRKSSIFCHQSTKEEEERQGRPLSYNERPVLTQLKTTTDVDDAAQEDAAESSGVNPEATDPAGAADHAANDEHQVNTEAPATSNDDDKTENESKDEKDKDIEGDKKEKKDEAKEGGARNLWVSGLSGDTRAKDLKQLCSKHGKVIGAKVVTNARTPGSRCYGYVTMASAQDAENCIKNLHRTELHGRMISVEKAKSESESSSRRQPAKPERKSSKERKEDGKENEENKEGGETGDKVKKEDEASGAESTRSTSRTREKSTRSDKEKARRSTRSRERKRSPREVLSFSKIWKERDVARARERSRAAREEERRRRAAEDALRERERRQRQEKHRLAMEREKLRSEREKIEREKNELLRLERERHRLEREKLELERLELKRAQLRLEEERRKRGYESSAAYRKPASSPPPEPAYERERHKRPPPPPMVSAARPTPAYTRSTSRGQFEAPPPPRFEMTASYDRGADKRDRERDYKRDYPRHVSSGNIKYPSNGSSNDDSRQPIPPGTRLKEPSRSYESRDSRSYRASPPGKPEPRNWSSSSRYPDAAPASKGSSTGGAAGGEGWAGGETRYGGYEARYPPQYQPPPPGASYPDRYAPPARDYPRKY